MKVDGLDLELKKLDLKNGDVISLSGPGVDALLERAEQLGVLEAQLEAAGLSEVLILLLPLGTDLSNLSEKEMNNYGWYRK